MKRLREWFCSHREPVVYILFGVATTVVNWMVYSLLVVFCRVGITASNAAAWLAAVVFAFWTNRRFVFRVPGKGPASVLWEGVRFLGTRILSGVVEVFLPSLLILMGVGGTFFGIEGFWAKAITSVFVVAMNYLLSKLLVFRKERSPGDPGEK